MRSNGYGEHLACRLAQRSVRQTFAGEGVLCQPLGVRLLHGPNTCDSACSSTPNACVWCSCIICMPMLASGMNGKLFPDVSCCL